MNRNASGVATRQPAQPAAAQASGRARPRVMIVDCMDEGFLINRLPVARALRDAGVDVVVVAPDTGRGEAIRQEGLTYIPLPIFRRGTSVAGELRAVWFLARLYRRMRPDLVHHVSIKPVIYGSFAARLVGQFPMVNTINGLGYTFTSRDRARALRAVITALYRAALRHPRHRTIFQNPDDRAEFVGMGVVRAEQALLIRGSGVNCERFHPQPEPTGEPIVMLPSRMLWDKGVKEFVEAARLLRQDGSRARFVLVGYSDPENPTAIPESQLQAWADEGIIEWWGRKSDMPQVLASAHIVVLPTFYREGVPKVLLEAAASGRPIVAADAPGSREIVRPSVNGLLVPPRDARSLAQAIHLLVESPLLRARFGRAGREIARTEFSEEIVVRKTLQVYQQLSGADWARRVEAQLDGPGSGQGSDRSSLPQAAAS